MADALDAQQTADAVGAHMFKNDRASKAMGMRIVAISEGADKRRTAHFWYKRFAAEEQQPDHGDGAHEAGPEPLPDPGDGAQPEAGS